ncbi:hypothetical protein [Streptomyces nigra]|uniref:hypothetical protein n=1 Tax=Streptomyces nigra TaxID=1827580 RepID=UPI003F4D83A6
MLERATAEGLRRRLVLVGRAAAGSDTFDRAAERLGVAIRTTPGTNAGAMAELTVSLMLRRGVRRQEVAWGTVPTVTHRMRAVRVSAARAGSREEDV